MSTLDEQIIEFEAHVLSQSVGIVIDDGCGTGVYLTILTDRVPALIEAHRADQQTIADRDATIAEMKAQLESLDNDQVFSNRLLDAYITARQQGVTVDHGIMLALCSAEKQTELSDAMQGADWYLESLQSQVRPEVMDR